MQMATENVESRESLILAFLSNEYDTIVSLLKTIHGNFSSLNRMLKTKTVDVEIKEVVGELSNQKVQI